MTPTMLGCVGAVAGAAISVRLASSVASGIAIIGGRSYRIGQVGSFVRIPQGYHDLFGIISEVGASATPAALLDARDHGERWMTVQLVGEIVEASFEREISQYPNVNDEVHLVTEDDLAKIYGTEEAGHVVVGRLANAESIPVRLDLDKLVTRHSAVLGSTGSGKSTTVASLLRSISLPMETGFPSARILLLDIHGEYARALNGIAEVFRVAPTGDEKPLVIPFWALPPADIITFLMGKVDERATTAILDKVFAAKAALVAAKPMAGVNPDSMTVDSPVPSQSSTSLVRIDRSRGKDLGRISQKYPRNCRGGGRQHTSATPLSTAHDYQLRAIPEQCWSPRRPAAARPDALAASRQAIRLPPEAG